MKLLRPRTFVIFALVGLSGAVLLQTSQNVQHAEERLQELELSVYREEEKIRMLRAEWENLNRPERLEKLANEFLDLVPPSPDQMADDGMMLPDPVYDTFEPEQDYEAVLQPAAYEVPTPSPQKTAPVPRHKPQPPAVQKSKPIKEKAFGELLDELGARHDVFSAFKV